MNLNIKGTYFSVVSCVPAAAEALFWGSVQVSDPGSVTDNGGAAGNNMLKLRVRAFRLQGTAASLKFTCTICKDKTCAGGATVSITHVICVSRYTSFCVSRRTSFCVSRHTSFCVFRHTSFCVSRHTSFCVFRHTSFCVSRHTSSVSPDTRQVINKKELHIYYICLTVHIIAFVTTSSRSHCKLTFNN